MLQSYSTVSWVLLSISSLASVDLGLVPFASVKQFATHSCHPVMGLLKVIESSINRSFWSMDRGLMSSTPSNLGFLGVCLHLAWILPGDSPTSSIHGHRAVHVGSLIVLSIAMGSASAIDGIKLSWPPGTLLLCLWGHFLSCHCSTSSSLLVKLHQSLDMVFCFNQVDHAMPHWVFLLSIIFNLDNFLLLWHRDALFLAFGIYTWSEVKRGTHCPLKLSSEWLFGCHTLLL